MALAMEGPELGASIHGRDAVGGGGAASPAKQSRARGRVAGGKRRPPSLPTGHLSQAAYARHRGVTRNAVWAAVKAGRIHLVGGLVDVEQADRDWVSNTDPTKQVRTAGPSTGTYNPFRVKTEDYKSRMAELKWAKEAGLFVDKDAFLAVAADRQRRALNTLQAVAARLGPVLAGISDPAECVRRIQEEMNLVARAIAGAADGKEPK